MERDELVETYKNMIIEEDMEYRDPFVIGMIEGVLEEDGTPERKLEKIRAIITALNLVEMT